MLHTRHTVKPNKYNKSLKSEFNTTINDKHNLLDEVGSGIKAMGRFS
ncbi:MAG: hypothetical protein QOK71_10460 [Nitrososphaeraceae archaeon]|nr:hypothetical protein [Nitrososphaeraceae archaeon]